MACHMIGITGGTCSGKTEVSKRLVAHLNGIGISATYVTHDWYYKDLSALALSVRDQQNFDHPAAIDNVLFDKHLNSLCLGNTVVAPKYDYSTHVRISDGLPVSPADVIVVDGIFLLAELHRRRQFALTVFLAVPDDIRLIRRVKRDVFHYGFSLEYVLNYWAERVYPMHHKYVASVEAYADLVVPNAQEEDLEQAINILIAAIEDGRK